VISRFIVFVFELLVGGTFGVSVQQWLFYPLLHRKKYIQPQTHFIF